MFIREILSVSRNIQRNFNDYLKDTGLGTGQVFILMKINENPGINQEKLCRMLNIDKSTVTKGMKLLMSEKYIIKVRDKNDLRNWILFPSKRGEAVYENVKIKIDDFEKTAVRNIGKEKLKMFSQLLSEIEMNTVT